MGLLSKVKKVAKAATGITAVQKVAAKLPPKVKTVAQVATGAALATKLQPAAQKFMNQQAKNLRIPSITKSLDVKTLVTKGPKAYAKGWAEGVKQDLGEMKEVYSDFKSGNFKKMGTQLVGDVAKAWGVKGSTADKLAQKYGGAVGKIGKVAASAKNLKETAANVKAGDYDAALESAKGIEGVGEYAEKLDAAKDTYANIQAGDYDAALERARDIGGPVATVAEDMQAGLDAYNQGVEQFEYLKSQFAGGLGQLGEQAAALSELRGSSFGEMLGSSPLAQRDPVGALNLAKGESIMQRRTASGAGLDVAAMSTPTTSAQQQAVQAAQTIAGDVAGRLTGGAQDGDASGLVNKRPPEQTGAEPEGYAPAPRQLGFFDQLLALFGLGPRE